MSAKAKNTWNTVTPLSKTIAMVLFITLPILGFYLGMQYQKKLDNPHMKKEHIKRYAPIDIGEKGRACTMEAKICPDGTAVGRSGPNCEFAKCPGE